MKWTNKGREFDTIWNHIKKHPKVILFGAGEYGEIIYQVLKNDVEISCFFDNDSRKHGSHYCGLPVKQPTLDEITEDSCVVVCISANVRSSVMEQLSNLGLQYGENLFTMEVYVSVYYAYAKGKTYLSSISFLPTTRCNLRCEACLNFTPYMKSFDERSLEQIKRDVDAFFHAVDYIILFHISGGEPMLYPHMKELVEYIGEHYLDKIHILKTVTNGTVLPKQELLETLGKYQVVVTVDDYREAVPHSCEIFEQLFSRLKQYKIPYEINKVDEWIDLAPLSTDHSGWSEKQLGAYFDSCHVPWQELRDGKLCSCNYNSYAIVAGLCQENQADFYDLKQFHRSKAKELIEFRLGYNERGYVEFCKNCSGYMDINPHKVPPAKQLSRKS